MIIRKKRIRSLDSNLGRLAKVKALVVGVGELERFKAKLHAMGFSKDLAEGEQLLPRSIGPISEFNANGKEIVHKDRPMETACRQIEWHWEEWHGPYREPQSKIVDVPYKRYPRSFVAPPSIEIKLAKAKSGGVLAVSPKISEPIKRTDLTLHIINLFLELFGECELLTAELDRFVSVPVRRLNWRVLPPGRRPWETLKKELKPIIDSYSDQQKPVIEFRLETVNKHGPDFVAVGEGGFSNYVIFGFPKKSLFVLESPHRDNATYVFGQDWEELSKLTKAEVLDANRQKERIIHRESWPGKVRELLK